MANRMVCRSEKGSFIFLCKVIYRPDSTVKTLVKSEQKVKKEKNQRRIGIKEKRKKGRYSVAR